MRTTIAITRQEGVQLRIAIFSDTYAPEIKGVARTLKRYTDYLEREGIDYQLFIPESRTPVPAIPHVERFTSIPFLLYPECRLAIPNPMLIKQRLTAFQPTLIHIATPFNLGLFGLHYGKKHHIPIVASYHTHFDDYLDYYNLPFLKRFVMRYMTWFHAAAERVYVPSPSTKEKLLSQGIHREIEVWGRGVNCVAYSPAKRSSSVRERFGIREKHVILYVGRIAPEKDVQLALETFRQLPDTIKEQAHLLIVGDGPLLKRLSEADPPQVTFAGFMEGEELSEVYASSDLFLFPSATETFGNVVLEAMASGLPVIGARAGGVQNLIAHGMNGYLCEAKCTADFLKQTSRLLSDGDLRSLLGEQARKYALSQSWDAIFNQLLTSFGQVVRTHKYDAREAYAKIG